MEAIMDQDKRKLTEKELKRKDDFEKLNSEMQQKGYKMINNFSIQPHHGFLFHFRHILLLPIDSFENASSWPFGST